MNNKIWIIIVSAILYGISIPLSKILLEQGIQSSMLGASMYIGAGIGLCIYSIFNKFALKQSLKSPLTRNELPFVILMILFDISAIILLMKGISMTNSANSSLLSNCEIATTSIIAFILFKEKISIRLWIAIILIIIAGTILTFEGKESLEFSIGSLYVIASYICWGAENNCTKKISSKNAIEITIIKGIFAGFGSLIIAFLTGENIPSVYLVIVALIIGFFSYGLSVAMYIKSQNYLGAAKTAAFFSIAPFLGVIFSIIILNEIPEINFYISLIIMIFASFFALNKIWLKK